MQLKKRTRTDYLVVHCAATTPKMDVGVKEIDQWHRARGFLKVGYHYVIRRSGKVEIGREVDEIGAHVLGHNSDSIGICLVGGVDERDRPQQNFTDEQYHSLNELLTTLFASYPTAELKGHRDFDSGKACPSFDVHAWWANQQHSQEPKA